jgi:hypothetical protein
LASGASLLRSIVAHSESAVEILHEYPAAGLMDLFERVAGALDDAVTQRTPTEAQVRDVNRARTDLRTVLRHQAFRNAPTRLRNGESGIYDLIAQHRFQDALDAMPPESRAIPEALPPMDRQRVALATLTLQPLPFTFIEKKLGPIVINEETGKPEKDPETGGPLRDPPFIEVKRQGTLAGYPGEPIPKLDEVTALLELRDLVGGGGEQEFRFGLLRAECKLGLRDTAGALDEYTSLLKSDTLQSARRKYVAIRAGFGRLASGDAIFRSSPTPDADTRTRAAHEYDEAVALLTENGVAPDNPQRAQIEAHAQLQKDRLAAGLNFLGLRAAFVPVQRFTKLQADADAELTAAGASARELLDFFENAERLIGEEMDLKHQEKLEQTANEIAAKQVANASLEVGKISEQIRLISDQEEFLNIKGGADILGAIFEGIAGTIGAAGGSLPSRPPALGVVNATVNFLAQKNELNHQRAIAEIEKDIADNAETIAALERQMSADRLRFLQEKLDFLEGKRINADLFFRLAEISERRAERQLELGVQLAYLFERAVAFFLGEPEISHVSFDYRDRHKDLLAAVDEARGVLEAAGLELDAIGLEKPDFFEEIVSLRQLFPLEFALFQQTGTMSFDYSLYQLSKRRPASHQCRLREVGVELSPPPPVTGFSGTLTHHGRFLIRDRKATLAPETERLIPTDNELNQALQEQREQGLAAATVGGILCYTLGPDAKELSLNTQFVSPPPEQFTLDIFEGYGPTGLWTLNIVDHASLAIQDVLLHFAIVSRESDTSAGGLQDKVRELVRAHETDLADGDLLDRISPFSLRQQFPDAFSALPDGPATIALEQERFPQGFANLQFKAVVAQALDVDDRGVVGVAVEVGRPEFGFTRARMTGQGGFSEDLSVPLEALGIDQRFPVVGDWVVRLPDPSQFSQLGDLRLFFLYAFEER